MTLKSPYWWFCKSWDPVKPLEFSSYVIGRHALLSAKYTRECGVVASYPDQDISPEMALKWLYELLTVLDSKASALMRLNGVMLAAAAFFLNPTYVTSPLVRSFVAGSGIGSTLSIAFCLLVVSVDWRFLGLMRKSCSAGDGKAQVDFTEEFFHLQQVANARQFFYRFAWAVSLITTGMFFAAATLFFFGRIAGQAG